MVTEKYWVFDLDGTLADSLTIHFKTLTTLFSQFNLEFTSAHEQEVLKLSANNFFSFLEKNLGEENASIANDEYVKLTLESIQHIKLFDGIDHILNTLLSRGAKIAIWTARDHRAASEIIKNTGLDKYASAFISGDCVSEGKPNPEGLKNIAEKFDCTPSEMIMVGDFDSDMKAAKSFNARSVRVTWHSSVKINKCNLSDWSFSQVGKMSDWVNQEVHNFI